MVDSIAANTEGLPPIFLCLHDQSIFGSALHPQLQAGSHKKGMHL
jgi:hypothetical protein